MFYCGTNFGQAAERDPAGLHAVLRMAVTRAGIEPTGRLFPELPGTVHLDILYEGDTAHFAVLVSRADREQAAKLYSRGHWQGLFTGVSWDLDGETKIQVPADFVDIFQISILNMHRSTT